MKIINNRYYDNNGNSWSCQVETEESAIQKSQTLIQCSGCSDFKFNPQRYLTNNIGSRSAQTYFYWNGNNQQVICGCFKGSLDDFEARVKQVHADSEHLQPYLKEIEKMRYLINN